MSIPTPRIRAWGTKRPIIKIGKLNSTITVPAFSEDCGFALASNYFNGFYDTPAGFESASPVDATNATFEAWVKVFADATNITNYAFTIEENDGSVARVQLGIRNGYLYYREWNGAVDGYTEVVTTYPISHGEWTHIAVSRSATEIAYYINGELQGTTARSGETLGALVQERFRLAHSKMGALTFVGSLCEVRVWNETRTADQIKANYWHFINKVIETGIIIYCRLVTFAADAAYDEVSEVSEFMVAPSSNAADTSHPALRMGGSFVAALFSVTATEAFSLKFPVTPPTNANFGMVVAYEDDNGDYQRRILFSPEVGELTINPPLVDYAGEKLPTTFNIEIWNVDGNDSVDLASDLTLDTSVLTDPTSSVDQAQQMLATPTKNINLFEPFPLTGFPLTFNNAATDW
jgi:hypothetical protein